MDEGASQSGRASGHTAHVHGTDDADLGEQVLVDGIVEVRDFPLRAPFLADSRSG